MIWFFFKFLFPFFSRNLATVKEQLEQVIPSTFQFVVSMLQIYLQTQALRTVNISTMLQIYTVIFSIKNGGITV